MRTPASRPEPGPSASGRHPARSAIIVDAGNTYRVDHPEIVATAAVAHDLPPRELRNLRLFRVDECLRVRRVETHEAPEPVTTPA